MPETKSSSMPETRSDLFFQQTIYHQLIQLVLLGLDWRKPRRVSYDDIQLVRLRTDSWSVSRNLIPWMFWQLIGKKRCICIKNLYIVVQYIIKVRTIIQITAKNSQTRHMCTPSLNVLMTCTCCPANITSSNRQVRAWNVDGSSWWWTRGFACMF
jgi:hypothetical protein